MNDTNNKLKTFYIEAILDRYDSIDDFRRDLKGLYNQVDQMTDIETKYINGLWYFMNKIRYLAIGRIQSKEMIDFSPRERFLVECVYASALKLEELNLKPTDLFLECIRYHYQALGGLVVTKKTA